MNNDSTIISYDKTFSYFTYALCHIKKNGIAGLALPQKQSCTHFEVSAFAKLCITLIIDGTSDFYYEFLTNLEYQNILRIQSDKALTDELFVVKNLASLLRVCDVSNIYYLIQHHCNFDVGETLLSEIIDTFGSGLKW